MITSEVAETLKNQDNTPFRNVPERDLYVSLLEVAIQDLKSHHPLLKRLATWWIYKDTSKKIDVVTGYVSFHAACEILDIDPGRLRAALKREKKEDGGNKAEHSPGSNGSGRPQGMARETRSPSQRSRGESESRSKKSAQLHL
jgi:hypothetical protein